MKPAALTMTLAAAAGLAVAQDQSQLPSCAARCVSKFTTMGGCNTGDIACVCKNKDFLNDIACCLADGCDKEDQEKTVQFATKLCKGSGVDVPDKVECKPSASGSSSTRSSAPSATGFATGASSSPTNAASPVLAGASTLAGALLAMVAAL